MNVIHPQGFTFLSFLVYNDNYEMLKEAINHPLKYVRDKYGNTPLTLALKSYNYDAVNLLLEYISNSDKLTA